MKKLLFVLFLGLFTVSQAQIISNATVKYRNASGAELVDNSGRPTSVGAVSETVTFSCAIDSLTTYTSSPFSLAGFDAVSFTTDPISYSKIVSSAGTPKVNVFMQASNGDGNWATVDTLLIADSIKTFSILGTINLNDVHALFYRFYALGATGNRRDSKVYTTLYIREKK